MTDLDQFAAAALKGLLANPNCDHLEDTDLATRAYEIASAMTEKRDHWNGIVAPTPTAEEREAIEWFAEVRKPLDSLDGGEYVATLRKLLERTNHDAVPAARAAEPESSVPLGSGAALANTQTAPPCVETDGPPSKGEGLSEAERAALTIAWMNLSETARRGLKKGHPEEECEPLRAASHTIRKLLERLS